ncbi:MAG TPA: hypothetical protein VFG52_06145, partial [Xanthomonadales bacterium]|nr:hypothetical protein [Xanthomonadales bacterium]
MKLPLLLSRLAVLGSLLASPAWAETAVQTEQLLLEFDGHGQLLSAQACFPDCAADSVRTLNLNHDAGLVSFSEVPKGQWQLEEQKLSRARVLSFHGPGEALVRWTVPDTGYDFELKTIDMGAVTLQAGESFRAREAPGFGEWLEQVRYLVIDPGNVRQVALDDEGAGQVAAEWAGFRSRFWAVLLTADELVPFAVQTGEANHDPVMTSQATPKAMDWQFYLGPVERMSLSATDELLPDIMYAGLWFWLRWICI